MSDTHDPEPLAVDLVVRGRVQGVFFRDSLRQRAEQTGVGGWVSNEPDGTVHGHLEGPADAVRAVAAWAEEGPADADVSTVDVTEVAVEGHRGFEVR